jgi:hypothetical protein
MNRPSGRLQAGRFRCALPASWSPLSPVACDSIIVVRAELREQPAAVQDGPAVPIEALMGRGRTAWIRWVPFKMRHRPRRDRPQPKSTRPALSRLSPHGRARSRTPDRADVAANKHRSVVTQAAGLVAHGPAEPRDPVGTSMQFGGRWVIRRSGNQQGVHKGRPSHHMPAARVPPGNRAGRFFG